MSSWHGRRFDLQINLLPWMHAGLWLAGAPPLIQNTTFVVPKTLNQQPNMPSGVGTMIDRAASLQPARAPKQQIPLAPCKGRGRFPAHEEDRVCLPSGSVGSILGKATSTTDFWNTVKQTNKQTKWAWHSTICTCSGALVHAATCELLSKNCAD